MSSESMSTPAPAILRIAFVTGTSPEKWFRRFSDRTGIAISALADDTASDLIVTGEADMALIRREGTGAEAGKGIDEACHRIHIYDEAWGVAFEKEHVFSVLEQVEDDEVADETVLVTTTSASELREMLPVVATGAGIALGPRPILRSLAKKAISSADVVQSGDLVEKTSIWLIWPKAADDVWRQEFAGVVHGRHAGSRRSVITQQQEPTRKLSAREKTMLKQKRRQAAGKKGGFGSAKKRRGPRRTK